jgi:hypothetical protein
MAGAPLLCLLHHHQLAPLPLSTPLASRGRVGVARSPVDGRARLAPQPVACMARRTAGVHWDLPRSAASGLLGRATQRLEPPRTSRLVTAGCASLPQARPRRRRPGRWPHLRLALDVALVKVLHGGEREAP